MQFLIDSVIKNGWSLAKKNFRFMILIMITILFIQGIFYSILSLVGGIDTQNLSIVSNVLINVVSIIIGVFINIGRKNVNLQVATKGSATYIDFWNKMPKLFFKFLWTAILYAIAIAILFILPGLLFFLGSKIIFILILAGILGFIAGIFTIIFVIRTQFFVYFVLDQKSRGHKALRQSRDITKGHLRELIGFGTAKFVLILFGAILAFVGLLRAIPACQIATADVYRKLTGTTKTVSSIPTKVAVTKKPIKKIVRKAK